MKNIKQTFKVFCSTNINDTVTKGLVDGLIEENKPLILEAIASTTSKDLDGDYMTLECLQDMKEQAKGLSIFLDHNHTIDKIVGSVTDVIETSPDVLKIKFSVLPKYEWYITDLLENGVNLGLSIGASVLDFEDTETGWKINKVKLVEISIVGIPANWDTFGTVQTSKELGEVTAKCFNGACKQIIDNLDLSKDLEMINKDIEDGEDPDEDGVITEEEVIKLINQAMIELKNQIITEIVTEYNLDGKKYAPNEEDDEVTDNQSTNSSNDKEDKEKDLEMEKEEIIELIKENSLTEDVVKELIIDALKEFNKVEVTEETPIEKEEEVEVTKTEEVEVEKEVETITEEIVEETPIEKSTEEVEEIVEEVELEKEVETIETPKLDFDELKKSIKEELRAEVEAEVEAELLKELSTERKPVETKQPKFEEVEKEITGEDAIEKSKGNVMSARKMAEHLLK